MIKTSDKPFGSGYFGDWITDKFGLPAYHYTCNQVTDPKAITPMNEEWRPKNEHLHQVGNDRLVGVASNFGHIQVRQDEGSPKYLNVHDPTEHQYAGGFGYLTDGTSVLCTYFSGQEENFERVFGVGYYRKSVQEKGLFVNQVIFAPYGDDPLLISQVKIENKRNEPVNLRWIEYWGNQQYQFSFKAVARALAGKKHPNLFRKRLSKRFSPITQVLDGEKGLSCTSNFEGYTFGDRLGWGFLKFMLNFVGKKLTGGPIRIPVKESVFEDLSPPTVFLVSLDEPFDSYGTDAETFFGEGGVHAPEGIHEPLPKNKVKSLESKTGLFLERKISLAPGESKTIYFAYGYLPEGFDLKSLVAKYSNDLPDLLAQSSDRWKKNRIELSVEDDWVDRELTWHHYYLRSNLTFDSFFKEHILSQGHVYQYIIGFQGAARDPLQHAMPFVFSDPDIVKNVIRYTLKTVTPEGRIPYGIVGSGLYMPSPFRPSDQEMWLLWLASEYVLATRDVAFLDEEIPTYPVYGRKAGKARVLDVLVSCYKHLVEVTGTGRHGLQRLSNGDWNDAMVVGYVPEENHLEVEEIGESVLNAAMGSYSLEIFSELMTFTNNQDIALDAKKRATAQREAVRAQWMGSWFKRAWLSEELGWVGEDRLWLEPQPWAIIGGAADADQARVLANSIDKEVRQSKIGARILGSPDSKMAGIPGTGTNAGIWPSINGTLVWALALVDGAMGWDEWKRNSLAYHAEAYPEIWYGIWSGPDTYNSDLAEYAGGTMHEGMDPPEQDESDDLTTGGFMSVAWTDFPVMNMHPHAWPLQNISKLLGIEFDSKGLTIAPTLPKEEYRFSTPLLDFERSEQGYKGRYAPLNPGHWSIKINLKEEELSRIVHVIINGCDEKLILEGNHIIVSGNSTPDEPLIWELRF